MTNVQKPINWLGSTKTSPFSVATGFSPQIVVLSRRRGESFEFFIQSYATRISIFLEIENQAIKVLKVKAIDLSVTAHVTHAHKVEFI